MYNYLTLLFFCCINLHLSPTHAQSNLRPFFSSPELPYSVFENFNTSLSINFDTPLQATDAENDPIQYYILNGGAGYLDFDISTSNDSNTWSGYLYFKNTVTLDRESRDEYNVRVYARDNQDHGNAPDLYVDIVVNILDINDVTPLITNSKKIFNVAEDTDTNSLLFQVTSRDDDAGQNGVVTYSLLQVDPVSGADKFTIYSSSGEVYLSQSLDYEGIKEYELTIEAEDLGADPLKTSGIFTIVVTDVNDNPPTFEQTLYSKQIYENASIGSLVLTVTAYDQDRMIDDDIEYYFNSTIPFINGTPAFLLNSSTGDITVNANLDADTGMTTYTLFVVGAEENDPDMVDTVPVTIAVVDINDNPPKFDKDEYNATLTELTTIGADVVTVMATDKDSGRNGEFEFELVNLLSTPLPFNISASPDGRSGTIQLIRSLDYEKYQMYKFQVLAVEIADVHTATTTVSVTVKNENDNDPVFSQDSYAANISENVMAGAFVTQVLATDNDLGTFGSVYYYIVNDFGKFSINSTNGMITTKASIDFEQDKSFSLTIVANDSAMPPTPQKTQKVLVQVAVLDRNDNGPVIMVNGSKDVTQVTRSLEEAQTPGQLIFVVDAEDIDEYPNNDLDYYLKVIKPVNLTEKPFEFSSTARNQLVTRQMLDYEDVQEYTVRLFVTDLGDLLGSNIGGSGLSVSSGSSLVHSSGTIPPDHVDFIDIIVKVLDENDNSPIFVNGVTAYAFDVKEEQANGTFVGNVQATDDDSKLFGTVRYSISGIGHENFTINPVSGNITTVGLLDREKQDRFDLIVTAYDLDPVQPLSATAALTLTVIDINDNNPVFDQPIYYENDIVENENLISISVSATDRDIGSNSQLTYRIASGNEDYILTINPSTGVIMRNVSKELDRESVPEFHLIVSAVDNGVSPRTGNATVIIVLQDVDDNNPTFNSSTYFINIPEDIASGSVVTEVTADDPDFGPNGVVRYSLDPSSSSFSININTGVIRSTTSFNHETGPNSFTLYVRADDNGDMGGPGYTNVVVTIVDVNDNRPIFRQSSYGQVVREDIEDDTSIINVYASDADFGDNGKVTYMITDVQTIGVVVPTEDNADNVTDLFTLDDEDGELYLSHDRSLDFESVRGYNIYIAAVDDGATKMTGTTVVTITVSDVNDNEPELDSEYYNFTLSESTPVNSLYNALVSSTDDDSGVNGLLTYSLEGTSVFSIDPSTGIFKLVSPLNFEVDESYTFTLVVKDNGIPPNNDTATVEVYVTDANDNNPQFNTSSLNVNISVYEGNYTVGNVELFDFDAVDIDSDLNGEVVYAVSPSGIFNIDNVNGRLSVVSELDRETQSQYLLVITAKDKGMPPRSAVTTATVTVLDINEEPPQFSAEFYSFNLNENSMINLTMVTVSAEDDDFGVNGTVVYSVDNDTLVSIDKHTGVIKSGLSYDYEEMTEFSILVTASDEGYPTSLSSSVYFNVTINDLNDNKPVFEDASYGPFTISEDTGVGYSLAVVSATDADSESNGEVSYQLENGGGRFSINTDSGEITLVSSLDRETTPVYDLIVNAYDHGLPSRKSSSVSFTVTISDINDNSPEFTNQVVIETVPEDTGKGSLITTLTAKDADVGLNGTIEFTIQPSNNLFTITTISGAANEYLGQIYLDGNFDYESEVTNYILTIVASDMGTPSAMSSTANVIISVTNVNDNDPKFVPSNSYMFYVSEVATGNSSIGTIQAIDDDAGLFGQIANYSFADGTPSEIRRNFTINSTTGVISLESSAVLDYETRNRYNFSVKVTDKGGRSSLASVVIEVIDYNDNQPTFNSSYYTTSVYENVGIGHTIIQVHATDNEGGTNTITYSIVEGSFSVFTINPSNGVITTNGTLDRENRAVYVLRVRATDNGGNPLSGFAQVEINILDWNDNAPYFSTNVREYEVVETADPLTTIFMPIVTATDDDIGQNGVIIYHLTGEGVPSVFNINPTTGEITLQSGLNHEIKQNYTLTLYATDNGTIPMTSNNVTITIYVRDFNDNAPVLNPSTYYKAVNETFLSGGLLIKISATDADQPGPNSQIYYSIIEVVGLPLSASPFTINNMSGEIFTTSSLDYEQMETYSIIVKAQDNGIPTKSAEGTVVIAVLDVNDNGPIFTLSSYVVSTDERNVTTDDIFLLPVTASDNDGTYPNNFVTYTISTGGDDIFVINSTTGEVFAIKDLDYETQHSYTFTVTASDNPINANRISNSTQVTVNLEDVNDNYPVWENTFYRVGSSDLYYGVVSEGSHSGTVIVRVLASDRDSGPRGTITYNMLTPTDKFRIETDNNNGYGYVRAVGDLDFNIDNHYNLTIEARDNGSPYKSATAIVSISVTDINDRAPSFLSSFFTETITEAAPINSFVITVTAVDSDTTNLTYFILSGNDNGFFNINPDNGDIIVNSTLDRETQENVQLMILVTDGTYNATTILLITITDVNDNAPLFMDTHYYANITENTISGPVKLYNSQWDTTIIVATDDDKRNTPNSIVVYDLEGPNNDYLHIEPSLGVLTVISGANFDYEHQQIVEVLVVAEDTAPILNRLSSNVTLTINVQDANDVIPAFNQTSYSVPIKENASIGSTVGVYIRADDVDTGLGGEVQYSIVSSTPPFLINSFSINSTTGEIKIINQLDRETSNRINLTVMARDSIHPFNSALVPVILNLEDVNDNPPKFGQDVYFVQKQENISIGSSIITVDAIDSDISINSVVMYYVITMSDTFEINRNTGQISTKVALDREATPTLSFVIRACDMGSPQLCSEATVILTLLDVNDVSPQFDYDVYRTSLCNDSAVSDVVLHIIATDDDAGLNGEIIYSINPFNPLLSFDNSTGRIYLASSIVSSHIGTNISFVVTATDRGNPPLSDTAEVIIQICDRDSAIVAFNQSYYYGSLKENLSPPAVVTTVSAESTAGSLTYSIVPPLRTLPFNISSTGVITTTQELDREQRSIYTLLLEAVDSTAKTAYATITVSVIDVNDNNPLFLLTPYSFSITEEQTSNVVLGRAHAIDPDRPSAVPGIEYSLDPSTNPNGAFEIDSVNGTITAIIPIDRETTDTIRLDILATDLDPLGSLNTTTTAAISVLDINDNEPIFDSNYYYKFIPENTPINYAIGRVNATDSDVGDNKRIIYSIVSGSNGKFVMEPNYGVLSIAGSLDYKTVPFYNLTIKAQDAGISSLSSLTYFEVYLEDVNDCSPHFTQRTYRYGNLQENSSTNLQLFDIDVTDCDSGQNKNVTFAITGGDSSAFTINPWTGVITLTSSLDYEQTDEYNFEVSATDLGVPSQFNLTTVHISISDINDETPMFFGAPYTSSIYEDVTPGYILLTVTATDGDRSSANNQLLFRFIFGNELNHFSIHQTSGAISVSNPLNRELNDKYYLGISVTDNGVPSRSATTTLNVTILDVNDNNPIFTNLPLISPLRIKENSTNVTDLIYTVMATDEDIGNNGRLNYELNTFLSIFQIGQDSGEINRISVIDYEQTKEYELSIQVTDSSPPYRTNQESLLVVIEDINDNNPVFTQSVYTGTQLEETDPRVIVTVTATDDDGTDANSAVTYIITRCNMCQNETVFSINSTSGEISNTRRLDREMDSHYELSVMAINEGAVPQLNTTTNVIITVTDVNDHSPDFNQSSYAQTISELIPDGSYVLTVLATDDDEPNTENSEVQYTIITNIGNNPFRLDPINGILSISGSLDRESTPEYHFSIRASDQGNPDPKTTDVSVTITLTDENDQPPQFNERTASVRVSEGVNTFPHILWRPEYTDDDSAPANKISQFGLLSISQSLDNSLMYVNATSGAVYLMGPINYETTKSLTALISVNNTRVGYCSNNTVIYECELWDSAELTIEVTDTNDNPPVLSRTAYTSQVSTQAATGTQLLQITATDRDTQNDYGTIRYRLGQGSSAKFRVTSDGWITTRGTFVNNDGERFSVFVEAYDNLGNEPSFTSTATVEILAISDFKRVLVLFGIPLSDITDEKEAFIIDTLHNLTGYTIIVERFREHVLGDSGEINSEKTDFIFHAIDPDTGEIVDFDVFIQRLNVERFFEILAKCNPESITSLQETTDYPPLETIMIFLIVLCFILIVGALVTLVLACQQRYIAIQSIRRDQAGIFFTDPNLLEGGAMPRDLSGESFEMKGKTTNNVMYRPPFFITSLETSGRASTVGDASSMLQDNPLYGEEELRVDLFQPPSDDDTEADIDEGRLLHAAINTHYGVEIIEIDDDDDDEATLI